MRAIRLSLAALLAIFAAALPAAASPKCVQKHLTALGYAPGPMDGVLGRKTVDAAAAFAADVGLDLPPLDAENAGAWCSELTSFVSGPGAAVLASPAARILPKDVLLAFARVEPDARKKMCALRRDMLGTLDDIDPVKKIEGFTSRMKGDPVPGAQAAETFAGEIAAQAAYATAAGDDARRGKLLDLLQKWADAGAFLDTISCVRPNGDLITTGKCSEWTVPDGSDKSGMKDATFATFLAVGMIRTYTIALADFERGARKAQHEAIERWASAIGRRLKRPTGVYFGLNMGWYWPSITQDLAAGRTDAARAKLNRLQAGIARLVNADGSIKDRTTRGDRALWYHYTSVGEIVVSMEMMRAAGIAIAASLEERLHKAVALFVAGVQDPATLDPWASQQHNAKYDGKQDWNFAGWPNSDFAGSWLHIYPFRYPERSEAIALRKLVRPTAQSATKDIDFGLGVGCLYNAAALGRS